MAKDEEQNTSIELPIYVERGLSLLYGEVVSLDVLEDFLAHWSVYTQGERLGQMPIGNQHSQQRTLVPIGDVQNFASCLQGLEKIETYLHALKQGDEEDRLLAICVLGESNLPETREVLVPFLSSSLPKERWLSAIELGQRKDEVAFPLLKDMLTEFFPSRESPTLVNDLSFFNELRWKVLATIELWSNPELVTTFRSAFIRCLEAEDYLPRVSKMSPVRSSWCMYQEALVEALGRRGALGALTGIPLSASRLRQLVVLIVAAFCHVEDYRGEVWEWEPAWVRSQEFREKMQKVFSQQFGMSEEVQEEYFEKYNVDYCGHLLTEGSEKS